MQHSESNAAVAQDTFCALLYRLLWLGQWLWLSWQSGRFRSPEPEIRGSNPDISEILSTKCKIEKTKIKKKRQGMSHLLKRK